MVRFLLGVFLLGIVPSALPAQKGQEKKDIPPPGWVVEKVPDWVKPFQGKAGLSEAWSRRPGPLGSSVAGLDRWQANHFIVYRPETAKFLYSSYTPLKVDYRSGTWPTFEKLAAKYTAGLKSNKDKALALLTKALPDNFRHPTIPPYGGKARPDRNLEDEALLESHCGWCNEQARVFVRLCQVIGIPARLVFLFYADERSGHVVAEFYAEERWSMADTSWWCVFPGADGHFLSAAEAHEQQGKIIAEKAYRARFQELLKLSDTELVGPTRDPAKVRQSLQSRDPEPLGSFGLLNYPLP
jgi:hypothetical protein